MGYVANKVTMCQRPPLRPIIPKSSSSLTSRVITGGAWMIVLRLVTRSTSIIVTLILARLLNPADFGPYSVIIKCKSNEDLTPLPP